MNWPRVHQITAAFVFVWSLVLYLLTVAPTASFWDAGEFIAISHGLQVSHPPGAPFYMLVGRFFSMWVPKEYAALAVNLVSVLASAFTVLLTHLIIVRLVRQWQGAREALTGVQHIAALAGGVIGALTFAATDSFWFNAVEAEVYASSMLFTALVVWLIMKWSDQAAQEEAALAGGTSHPFGLQANRYLILIAYLFGLAIGVHLLNLLAVFFIALIFFFTEYDREDWTTSKRWVGIGLAGVVSVVIFLLIYPFLIQTIPDWAGKSGAPILFMIAFVALVAFAVWYTQKSGWAASNLVMLGIVAVLIGYSTYGVIFIRSAADPPIDENDPETAEAIVSYLKREQYGSSPIFPRRHSPEPSHQFVYRQYDTDGAYFWQYQMGHMYWRYFLWQFVGRDSDVQDAPAITGLRFIDDGIPNRVTYFQTPSEEKSRNAYYGLPLLLGLFGMAFHFVRDWRRAFSVLVLFLVTGVGIILYLNQTPMQPRERDYSYVASFFAFSLWIGIGATGLIELAGEALRKGTEGGRRSIALGIGAVLFLAVPLLMTLVNYDDHDRSGQYVAPDYAFNMLNSVAPNGVLFTNGDNDTFPLWYLQEVERVRTDVRVANLSLLQTPWYIKQLKNQQSRESAPLPISFSDAEVDNIAPRRWNPQDVTLPVDRDALLGGSEMGSGISPEDADRIESPMRWRLQGRYFGRDASGEDVHALFPNDLAVLNLLQTNAQQGWQRPVYFAVTVSPDGQLDLQNYFQLEGQAYRIVPIRHEEQLGRVVPEITIPNLRGFRFRGLNNPDIYFDENIRRMVDNYRNIFSRAAQTLVENGRSAEAIELLDWFLEQVPFETIPGDARSFTFMARAYLAAGATQQATAIMKKAEPLALDRIQNAPPGRDAEFAVSFVQMVRYTYLAAGDFQAASEFGTRLADAVGQDEFRQSPEQLRSEYEEARRNLMLDEAAPAAESAPADTASSALLAPQ